MSAAGSTYSEPLFRASHRGVAFAHRLEGMLEQRLAFFPCRLLWVMFTCACPRLLREQAQTIRERTALRQHVYKTGKERKPPIAGESPLWGAIPVHPGP